MSNRTRESNESSFVVQLQVGGELVKSSAFTIWRHVVARSITLLYLFTLKDCTDDAERFEVVFICETCAIFDQPE